MVSRTAKPENMKRLLHSLFLTACLLLVPEILCQAQYNPSHVTNDEKKQVIDSVGRRLNEFYIYPTVAGKIVSLISKNLENGVYDSINDPNEFAAKVTQDLVSVSNDKHLKVEFDPEWILESRKTVNQPKSLELLSRELPKWRRGNFGFKEVKMLDGNVGYLNLTAFHYTEYGGETAVAAMNFLSNADALIIDLRNNYGGDSSMVQLVSSYLYDSKPVLLGDFYFRNGGTETHTQEWTLPFVSGKKRPDIDLYILTSGKTFSAAEAFTYSLKNYKRATIIGETTAGGAHFIDRQIATDRFSIWVANGKSIDPVTKTDWEKVGVKPHVEVPAKDALAVAQIRALEKLAGTASDGKNTYLWHLAALKAKQNPVQIEQSTLALYVGTYTGTFGQRKVTLENGKLFSQREGGEKYALLPIASDLFTSEETPQFRLKIVRENDKVTGVVSLSEDGSSMKEIRDKP